GPVVEVAGTGETMMSGSPSILSDFVRTGARYSMPLVGSVFDYSLLKAQGKDNEEAMLKSTAHLGAGMIGLEAGAMIGGPAGAAAGFVIAAGVSAIYDVIYDNKDKIGDAISGAWDSVTSIFN